MSDSEKTELAKISGQLESMMDELASIKRGIYGDEKNKYQGLIDRQDRDERRIDAIENRQWKSAFIIGGLLVVLEVAWNYLKDKVL
jgi:hypothetical protein